MCETNPNLGILAYLVNETRVAEQMRQTNPIPGGVLYKQTQFQPLCRSGGRRSREGECAKQSQTWAPWGIWGAVSALAGANYAKQTQSAWFHHRGTEIAEAVSGSWRDITPISFSVPSVSPW
jgi:hypothetical protein